jgi:GTP-binding protein
LEVWLAENNHIPGFVFCGRSNVGKSSLINALFNHRIAKTSKTPGRTQTVNIFSFSVLDSEREYYFFDLPGFGYAQVSKQMSNNWDILMDCFFNTLSFNKLLVHIQDSRNILQTADQQFYDYIKNFDFEAYLILNKMDKLNQKERSKLKKSLNERSKEFKKYQQIFKVSAEKKTGIPELEMSLLNFLNRFQD